MSVPGWARRYDACMRRSRTIPGPGSNGGHTLIELVVALAILVIMAAGAAFGLVRATEQTSARGTAQILQMAAVRAQTAALWGEGSAAVSLTTRGVRVQPAFAVAGAYDGPGGPVPVGTNLARWRSGESVQLRFGPSFGAPDGAGTVFLAGPAGNVAVVIRAESGLTRRELR